MRREVFTIKRYIKIIPFILIFILIFTYPIQQEEVLRLDKYEDENIKKVYLIQMNNEPYQLLQKVSVKGYKDEIIMFIQIDMQKESINKLEIIYQNETSHYGGHISEEWFLNRFEGKDTTLTLEIVKMSAKKEEEVVAVTGATISSQAVVRGVNKVLSNYREIKNNIK